MSYQILFHLKSSQVCIAVLAPARNVITGQCRYFSDPCHVPPIFYIEDDSCANEIPIPQ